MSTPTQYVFFALWYEPDKLHPMREDGTPRMVAMVKRYTYQTWDAALAASRTMRGRLHDVMPDNAHFTDNPADIYRPEITEIQYERDSSTNRDEAA